VSSALSGSAAYSRGQRAAIIGSAMLGFGLDMYNILILTFVFDAIRTTFSASLEAASAVATATLTGSVIGGIAFGVIGDRLGRKIALQWALVAFSLGTIASAFSSNIWILIALRFITGIGLGGEWGAGMVLFNEAWDDRYRGFGSAAIQAMSVVGGAAASIVGLWAISRYGTSFGWRVALFIGGAPILLMIFVRYVMPESKVWQAHTADKLNEDPARRNPLDNGWLALVSKPYRSRLIGGVVWLMSYMFTFYAIVVFLPTFWIKTLGVPASTVRTIILVGSVLNIASYLALGMLNDRFGRRWGALVPALFMLVSVLIMWEFADDRFAGDLFRWPMLWAYLIFAMGTAALGVSGPWISELFPVALRSTATSTIYMGGRALGSFAPLAVSVIAGISGGNLWFGMMVALPSAALFLLSTMILPETHRPSVTKIDCAGVEPVVPDAASRRGC